MLAFKYISFHYLKYFLVILMALVLFLVGFDYMENAQELSSSANLVLIYLVYKVFFAIDMLLPLSLIFAMITTKIFLIRSNALVSFYSLGYSRVDVLKPFVVVSSSVIILLYLYTHFRVFQEQMSFLIIYVKMRHILALLRTCFSHIKISMYISQNYCHFKKKLKELESLV